MFSLITVYCWYLVLDTSFVFTQILQLTSFFSKPLSDVTAKCSVILSFCSTFCHCLLGNPENLLPHAAENHQMWRFSNLTYC